MEWLQASEADLADLDFEAPILDTHTSDSGEISELYSRAADTCASEDEARIKVYKCIAAVTGMHFRPAEGNDPFGPMAISSEGFRTACPSDFRSHIGFIANLASAASNVTLRARTADLCWLLDRSRGQHARIAISCYSEIALRLMKGELRRRYNNDCDASFHDSADLLRRALWLARAAGAWDDTEGLAARRATLDIRLRAIGDRSPHSTLWLSELDLDHSVSKPGEVADGLETALKALKPDRDIYLVCTLWRSAARAHHLAGASGAKDRCLTSASECLVGQAEKMKASPVIEAHFLSAAISQLHGVAGVKERRTALRHRLIDVQASIPDELPRFSHDMGLGDALERLRSAFSRHDLFEQMFLFAEIERSPDLETLKAEAKAMIQQFPLSSLFAPVILDHDGKAVYRGSSASIGDTENDAAIQDRIAENESIRRAVATAKIDTARIEMIDQNYISDDFFLSLMQHSPFVPHGLLLTYSRGFVRFFQGDFISATYVLTPMLEASLRHVLKSCGYDVSIFDDATQTQQDSTISRLFEQMRPELEAIFSPAIIGDLERLFLAKSGPHVRHGVAHGLLRDQDVYGSHAVYACWLLFRLCLMPLFPHVAELRSFLKPDVDKSELD